jgi:hypothetical protein
LTRYLSPLVIPAKVRGIRCEAFDAKHSVRSIRCEAPGRHLVNLPEIPDQARDDGNTLSIQLQFSNKIVKWVDIQI